MSDLQEQLAMLRRRIARIDRKYAAPKLPPVRHPLLAPDPEPARYFVEEWLSGEEVHTDYGCHFETERLYEPHRCHGSLDVSTL